MIDFTIVTAVYNTAHYIDEAVTSVIHQSVGMDRIELILVNDASTDNSLEVCRRWERMYPGHIVVVDQGHNQGVSAARNVGKRMARGRYISFLDSDDKFAPDVCEQVALFFEQHKEEDFDVVAFPLIFFDGFTGSHPLNDKFESGTRIIDLDKEWYYAQNSMSCTFIKADTLRDYYFDTTMPLSEDLKIVQEILLLTHRLGVISDTRYYYRRRSAGELSAIQGKESRRVWYVPTLQNGLVYLSSKAKQQAGTIPRYLQFLMMYELQWRLKPKRVECPEMTSQECTEYYTLIHRLLSDIDDEVIMRQQHIAADTKVLALLLKRGWPFGLLSWCRSLRLLRLLSFLITKKHIRDDQTHF